MNEIKPHYMYLRVFAEEEQFVKLQPKVYPVFSQALEDESTQNYLSD
jgi:hypothetical protein